MEDSIATLGIEGSCELEDLCLDRSDGREEDCDDREVSEFFAEELLSKSEDDIRVVLSNLSARESEKDEDDEDEKEKDQEDHRVECRTSWRDSRIASLLSEIHRNIPTIVEEYWYQCSLDKCREREGEGREPLPWEGMDGILAEVIKSNDDDQEEYDRFYHRENDLSIARELDALDDDSGDDRENRDSNCCDPCDIIHKGWCYDEEDRISRGDSCWDHEDTTEDKECPSRKKSCRLPKDRRHPGKWCSCIGIQSVQMDKCPRNPEHDNPRYEDTRRGEDSCNTDDRESGCLDWEGWRCPRNSHDDGFKHSERVRSKSMILHNK